MAELSQAQIGMLEQRDRALILYMTQIAGLPGPKGDIGATGATGPAGPAYTDEQAQDAVAAMVVAGAGMTITYNDPANTLTFVSTATGTASYDDIINAVFLNQ